MKLVTNLIALAAHLATSSAEGTCTVVNNNIPKIGACFEGNYNITDSCAAISNAGQCTIAPKPGWCGCQVTNADGTILAIRTKYCDNPCVTVSSDVPKNSTCKASGSSVSWDKPCTARNLTFTPQCDNSETKSDGKTQCHITARRCGCLYWESYDNIQGIREPDNCDSCAVYGYHGTITSSASGFGLSVKAFVVSAMGAAWFAL